MYLALYESMYTMSSSLDLGLGVYWSGFRVARETYTQNERNAML
jgi:hypothetical protein